MIPDREIGIATAPPPVAIEFDLPCTACGYNLRGLSQTGGCPECGASIEVSLQGDLLRFANPRWLKSVRGGIDWMLVSVALAVATSTLQVLRFSFVVTSMWWSILAVLAAIEVGPRFPATWLITAREPRTSHADEQVTWRWIVRACAAMNLIFLLLRQIEIWRLSVGQNQVLDLVVSVVTRVAETVAIFGYFAYAQSLAKRVPNMRLVRSTRIVKWGLPGLQAIGLLGTLLFSLVLFPMIAGAGRAGTAGLSFPLWSIIGVNIIHGLASVALWLCALVLLYRFRKVLREAFGQDAGAEPRLIG